MRILLADDHPMIRAAIDVLLRDTDYEVVGIAGTGQATLEEIDRLQPDMLLLDVQMPGGSGLDVLRRLRASNSSLRVILLTAGIDDAELVEAKALKVRGIVLKNSDPAYLLECLDSVKAGRMWIDPELARRSRQLAATASHPRPPLAPRERQLIGFVRKGLRNREIAQQLGVTEGTVKAYLHAIFEKLGVGNRTELAIRADEFLAGQK
ncbi:MAG TPA: response regulator transcription factor [Sphingomicrobium sp.]|nr:response regulator transcription factor [Sphingomicrobium sp.]